MEKLNFKQKRDDSLFMDGAAGKIYNSASPMASLPLISHIPTVISLFTRLEHINYIYSRKKRRSKDVRAPLEMFTILLISLACLSLTQQILCLTTPNSIAPTIDYSHNMRILKLPKSTPVGSLVYRLKGSDGDPNTQLTFGVLGPEARSILEILPVAHSWNEADVYLRTNLEQLVQENHNSNNKYTSNNDLHQFNLTLYVSDGNLTTQIESRIIVTDPESEGATAPGGDSALPLTSAFTNTRHIFHIAENLNLDEPLGQVNVLESDSSDLPVRFELRGRGADKFAIKYVFGPRGQSRGEIVLAQQVDYEKQNLFNLKILALNAWTDTKWDTRNVVTMDIVITLSDVQDTAPIFKSAPSSLRITNTMQMGDLVGQVEAEDGDLGDQRPVHFALDASSPLANYFQIDKLSGQLRLTRSMQELGLHAAWDSPTWSVLTVIASEPPDPASYDRLWPPMYSKLELPLMLVDVLNEPPQFVGGWQTQQRPNQRQQEKEHDNQLQKPTNGHVKPGQNSNILNLMQDVASGQPEKQPTLLHAFLTEISSSNRDPSGLAVQWYTNGSIDSTSGQTFARPVVMDLGLGQNGTFQVHLEGPDAALFRLEPSLPVAKQSNLMLFVADQVAPSNWSLFDRDQNTMQRDFFRVDLVARDFGIPQRLTSRISCQIDLLDVNDNAPQFDAELYSFQVYENAQRGHLVGVVRARDPDLASSAVNHNHALNNQASPSSTSTARQTAIRYGPLTGPNSHLFRVQPETGQILLEGQLDRERESIYLLLLEASDLAGNTNYTRLVINVLDVNDNSPQFLQSHYDAVLLADGTFHQPLLVRAIDADEPGTANSQVAYEIIAGNRDEQFVIDSLSGAIYPTGQQPATFSSDHHQLLPPPTNLLPPSINQPIEPFNRTLMGGTGGLGGKILPGREIEETTWPSSSGQIGITKSRQLSLEESSKNVNSNDGIIQQKPDLGKRMVSSEEKVAFEPAPKSNYLAPNTGNQMPFYDDLMLKSESQNPEVDANTRSLVNRFEQRYSSSHSAKLPPIITLIVRAHDFGIPLRSSTVRVNIYNQAQLSRTLSVILNGTAEQIDSRRESIERAFSSLTGSRATIESVESLSDSSSLCVAHVRLVVPQHSLVDLTDLSALMDAIDYRPHSYTHPYSHAYPPQHEHPGVVYYNPPGSGPQQPRNPSINNNNPTGPTPFHTESTGSGSSSAANITSMFPEFTNQFHLNGVDPSRAAVERRLLIYIIIVAICILSLLVLWMVYSCSNQNSENHHRDNINNLNNNRSQILINNDTKGRKSDDKPSSGDTHSHRHARDKGTNTKRESIGINTDAKQWHQHRRQNSGTERPNSLSILASPMGTAGPGGMSLLQVPYTIGPDGLAQPVTGLKPDRLSMYNGQVWFEPMPLQPGMTSQHQMLHQQQMQPDDQSRLIQRPQSSMAYQRRASSAPSVNGSLHSGLHNTVRAGARGQFFPNARGYTQNLKSMEANNNNQSLNINHHASHSTMSSKRRLTRKRVAPMVDESTMISMVDTGEMMDNKGSRQISSDVDGANDRNNRSGSLSSANDLSSSGETLILDSDQELLGFDSTGTPIIATLTNRPTQISRRSSLITDHNGEPLLHHRTQSPIKPSNPSHTTSATPIKPQKQTNTTAAKQIYETETPKTISNNDVDKQTHHTHQDLTTTTGATKPTDDKSNLEKKPNSNGTSTKKGPLNGNAGGDSVIEELNERLKKQRKSIESSASNDRTKQEDLSDGDRNNKPNEKTPVANTDGEKQPTSSKAKITQWKTVDRQENIDPIEDSNPSKPKPIRENSTEKPMSASSGSIGGGDSFNVTNNKIGPSRISFENQMKNGDLLKKDSIFALTYKQLAAEKLPTD